MIRFLLFLLLLIPLALAGKWLMDYPGEVNVVWMGYDVTLHIVVFAFLLLLLIVLVALISVGIWQITTWPKRRRVRAQHRTFTRGLEQLTRGVTALALGDEIAAHEALKKALTALPGEPLPQLLTAQLLQRQGRHEDARLYFRGLMTHAITTELATRRLIEQHLNNREWLEAITLAEQARKITPRDRWLALTLIDLYARTQDATQMLALTEGWQWQSPLTKEERHRYAALAHYLSVPRMANAHLKAQELHHAVGYAPDFLPAIIDYAAMLQADESPRRARKWLRSAWLASPNPLLIPPILATLANESPRTQERLLRPFLKGTMTATHYQLAAQQAMQVDEYERAREALEDALSLEESKTACTLMAEVEKELRGGEASHAWLARAVDAPTGPTWVCMQCGTIHPQWHMHCESCQGFDTLRYERPETRITSLELTTRD